MLRCSLLETKHGKTWFYLINPFTLWIYYGVIILKEIWDCCDFFTLRGERVNFRWKLPFYFIIIIIIIFIHQNLYFKLKDSSCSLFYATDVAKQNNIRFKEAALLLSSRRTTSGLDKGKTASGGKSEPKTLCFDKSTHVCIATDKLHRKQDCHWNLMQCLLSHRREETSEMSTWRN